MNVIKILLNAAAGIAMNPQVVHSLPGRLRIHIPALKMVPEKWQVDASFFAEMLTSIPPVHRVEVSYITANVLVTYDHERITEMQIMEGIKRAGKFLVANREVLQRTDPRMLPQKVKEMVLHFIKENVGEALPSYENST